MNEILTLLPVMQAAAPDMLFTLAPIGLVILVFYFLILRPQNKKQKELKQMLASLKKNDKVMTIGGIHGTVANK
jgi:preprotein translocase subunit YajC